MRSKRCSRGALLTLAEKRFSRKKQEHEDQRVSRVLENPHCIVQPFALAGKKPRKQADGERDGNRKYREPQDGKHSTVLGGEAGNARRSVFRPFEDHGLEGRRIGEGGA